MGFHAMKQWWVVVVIVAGVFMITPLAIFAAPYPDPIIQDSEYVVRYDGLGKAIVNYRLAQFAAKLAAQVYKDTGSSDFAAEEMPVIGNYLYDTNLAKQTASLQYNGFKKENIWLVNHYDDPAVKSKRQQDVSTGAAIAAKLVAAGADRTIRMSDANMQLIARASLQAILAKKQIVYNGVKRNLWVIVFRGTEGFAPNGIVDWECNLAASEEAFNPVPDTMKVHRGFFASVRAFESAPAGKTAINIEDKIKAERRPEDIFLVVGHSLGGANATLFGAKLISPNYYGIPRDNVLVYTFGAPSVGNADFRYIFDGEATNALRLNLLRIRHKYDFIPYSSYLSSIADDSESFAKNMLIGGSPGPVFLATTVTRILANSMEKFPFVHIGMVHTFDTDPTVQELSGGSEERFAGYNPHDWFKIEGELANGTPNHKMTTYDKLTYAGATGQAQSDITAPVITISPADTITYTTAINVTATMNEPGKIHCSTDGTEPQYNAANLNVFSTVVDRNSTIKCFSVDQAGNTSATITRHYTNSYINPASATPYLEIQVPAAVRALSLNNALHLTTADKVRLYPKNDNNWPDYRTLTGTVSVWLTDQNNKDYPVPGTLLADGGVEFSITAAMPANIYYNDIAVYDNQQHRTPGYTVQQVVEMPGGTTGGGTGGGTSTTGAITLPRTGQTVCYNTAGTVITCADSGQDGATQAGATLPVTRFTDNGNGTITDNLTTLIWLKNANCTETAGGIAKANGYLTWDNAMTWSKGLASGVCGLSDGSAAGQWRLPNRFELESLVNYGQTNPSTWLNSQGFSAVQASNYWSSSTVAGYIEVAWGVYMNDGYVNYSFGKTNKGYVWPVRGGQ